MKKQFSAISVWQPWAWLIVNGYKDVENRDWAPIGEKIGQRIAIHAPLRKVTKDEYVEFLKVVKERRIKKYPKSPDDFVYGAVIGTAVLEKVAKRIKSYWAQRGSFHWKLCAARKVKPKFVRGVQSWFSVKL